MCHKKITEEYLREENRTMRSDAQQMRKDLETVAIYLRDIMDRVDTRMDDIFDILDRYDESTFHSSEEAIKALHRSVGTDSK